MTADRPSWLGRAAAEGLIIVASVMVALALDAWWSARSDRAREATILEDLATEFRANRNELASDIEGNEILLAATRRIIGLGGEGLAALPPDTVRALAVASVRMRTFDPYSAVLSSVIAAGEFALISDPELRESLAAWGDGLEELRREQILASEWHNTLLIPRIFQSPSTRPVTSDVVGALGLFEVHVVKHRTAVTESRRLLELIDGVLARLPSGEPQGSDPRR